MCRLAYCVLLLLALLIVPDAVPSTTLAEDAGALDIQAPTTVHWYQSAAVTLSSAEAAVVPMTHRPLTMASMFAGPVSGTLIADTTAITPGRSFHLGVELVIKPGWHIYSADAGNYGRPTEVVFKLPAGFKVGDLRWEHPQQLIDAGQKMVVYERHTVIAADITPPASLKSGDKVEIRAQVSWLACKDMCVPGHAQFRLVLPVATPGLPAATIHAEKFIHLFPAVTAIGKVTAGSGGSILNRRLKISGATGSHYLVFYLMAAFVGGLILNLMPCVLPVVSIKVLGLLEQAAEDRKKTLAMGLWYSAGTILTFLVLALGIIGIKRAGAVVGWGFQFQHPGFLVAMTAVVSLMALGLFDFFSVNFAFGQQTLDRSASQVGCRGAFFKGVLSCILSTPCSAPFLGTAIGFAFSQAWWVVLLIFLTVGAGMSAPYLVLTANPGWMRFLPKPGEWMMRFKEACGFMLLATAVWLLSVLQGEIGGHGVILILTFILSLTAIAWMISKFATSEHSRGWRLLVWLLALAGAVISAQLCVVPSVKLTPAASGSIGAGGIAWESFSIKALDQHIAQGQTVLVDFTADWCLTCKVNERMVINTKAVAHRLAKNHVVALRADWTRQDPDISRLLHKFGRDGVPCYVIFPANHPTEPILLPEIITQAMLLEKLDQAGPSKSPMKP